ncbi:alcohol dehydrogenase catalytic domain-containing protein [Nocardia brevicatena]|uniref:alcohol dehydrogenase catalytic domain-containing protein n=1 Tax=Nocardia brevicatena TaxID=37327 RepID=UPI0002EF32D5|nr:alcohol dehydrogenase catalytic domain-containing protein [Nocardia brevicatena]
MNTTQPTPAPEGTLDVLVIGAGISGIYQLYRLAQTDLSFAAVEAADGVGGTWYWNRYPGARFDSESYTYAYFFSKELREEWSWSEHFAGQPEIERYLNHVGDRFDLRKHITFETRVTAMDFDEDTHTWQVTTDRGDVIHTRFVITGIGMLSAPQFPPIPGIDDFRGVSAHTGLWPQEGIDVAGKKVAVIGTGSSGVQLISEIAGDVLLQVAAAGICHSDLHVLESERPMFRRPVVLGHEVTGRVVQLGEQVTEWSLGDSAIVHLCWSCGECVACRRGDDNLCVATGRRAQPPAPGLGPDGGMAELMRVPARYLVPLGDLDPVASAPLADAAMTPYHAIRHSRSLMRPGAMALVIGIGGLGHVGVQILATLEGVQIVALDVDEQRLKAAVDLGAHHTVAAGPDAAAQVLELTGGLGADVVFDFVGNTATTATAVDSVAPGGICQVPGLGGGVIPVRAEARTGRGWPWGAWLRSSYGGTRADLEACVRLAHEGRIAIEVETFPLADALEAFHRLAAGEVRGRAVLVP